MSARAREVYDRIAPWLVLAIGITTAIAMWVGVAGIFANNRQDAQAAAEQAARDKDTKALLKCFDDFASDLSGGLPPVRTATAASGDANAASWRSLRDGLVDISRDQFDGADLEHIITQIDAFLTANDHLGDVRKANPYPLPPSTFCATR